MKRAPKKNAEAEELAMGFLRLAHKNGYCLRVNGSLKDFVFKPVREGLEQDESWINVNLDDKSVNAIRLDRRCGTFNLHEVLTQMGVPHEFENQGAKELRMSLRHARKLEEACDRWGDQIRQSWKDRLRPCPERNESAAHSRD